MLQNDEDVRFGVEGLDWRTLTDIEHWLDKQDVLFDAEPLCTRDEPDILLGLFIREILQDEVNECEWLDDVEIQELELKHSHFTLDSYDSVSPFAAEVSIEGPFGVVHNLLECIIVELLTSTLPSGINASTEECPSKIVTVGFPSLL